MYPKILDLMYSDIKEGKKNISGKMSKGTHGFWEDRVNNVLDLVDALQRQLGAVGFLPETEYQQELDKIYQDFEEALHTLGTWKAHGDI